MLLINSKPVKLTSTKSAAVVLKSEHVSVTDSKHSVYVDGTKYAPDSLKRVYIRHNGNHVIEIKEEEDKPNEEDA